MAPEKMTWLLQMQLPKPIDLGNYQDREVLYMDRPYPRSKLANKVWYFRAPNGEYRPFAFQNKVRYSSHVTYEG